MGDRHHQSQKESERKSRQHRGPGGLIIQEPKNSKKIMEETYRKAELEQWNTKQERRELLDQ